MSSAARHHVLILGGGTAGITVAARLKRAAPQLELAVVEPSEVHYYQPLWTLVGAGIFPKEASCRPEADVIPPGVAWIKDAAQEIDPQQQWVRTAGGQQIGYDWLVVAAGIRVRWDAIPGLMEAIGHDGVCSNYAYQYVDYTWKCLRDFAGGNAIFTQPSGAIKCGGAPQKIMYLADDYFRRKGIRDRCTITFASAGKQIFAVEKYRVALEAVIARKGIHTRFRHDLTAIRAASRQAVFKQLDTGDVIELPYDLLHVTPPMGPPEFLARSPLADAHGWVEVHKETLQHVRFPNVFALGDCSSLPTSKTGAAVRKQAPVLVANLLAARQGRPLTARYNGYTSCPVVTGYGKLILAEFDYDHRPAETFPFDQSKERYSMWLLKKYGLPWMYWHGMLKGRL